MRANQGGIGARRLGSTLRTTAGRETFGRLEGANLSLRKGTDTGVFCTFATGAAVACCTLIAPEPFPVSLCIGTCGSSPARIESHVLEVIWATSAWAESSR